MKLLLDEGVVYDLKRDLIDHQVDTVVEAGFGGLRNGALLRAALGIYDVLLTVDRNMEYQQNVRGLQISILVLVAPGIKYPQLKPLVPQVLETLKEIKPGEIVTIQ